MDETLSLFKRRENHKDLLEAWQNFLFLISKGNFIQILNNESPKYTGSIQQETKIIKNINYKHPLNHRLKK